jgi:hypothetical protein
VADVPTARQTSHNSSRRYAAFALMQDFALQWRAVTKGWIKRRFTVDSDYP